jgi:hypothetical protein
MARGEKGTSICTSAISVKKRKSAKNALRNVALHLRPALGAIRAADLTISHVERFVDQKITAGIWGSLDQPLSRDSEALLHAWHRAETAARADHAAIRDARRVKTSR